jgi:hypothetical protein
MFEKKLRAAIQKYLDADTKPSRSGAKGAITKLINAASLTDVMLIPGVLQKFEELPNWLKLRFQKGSLYQEGERVFGWYREGQVQAVELPVVLDIFSYDDGEKNRIVKYIRVISGGMGFAPAIDVPFDGCRVDVSPDSDNFWELLEVGYASPCDLQWSWFERPRWSDKEGYVVERSIISHGFWQAWKWWPDCWQWYYGKRPELFEDAVWWGKEELELVRYEPPDPYAAVFSPSNSESLRSQLFFLDDT